MIKRTRKIYTARQKILAVQSCENRGVTHCSKKKGIPIPTLNKWIKDIKNGIELKKTGSRKGKRKVKCSVCGGKVEKAEL